MIQITRINVNFSNPLKNGSHINNDDECIKPKYCDYFDLGDNAPEFTLDGVCNGEKIQVKLRDYLGKWVVLFFYGSDFTFV